MYLMGGPRQLFFFQCGPEMPKGWAPLKPILLASADAKDASQPAASGEDWGVTPSSK